MSWFYGSNGGPNLDDLAGLSDGTITSITSGDKWSGAGKFLIPTPPAPDVFWAKFNEGTGTNFTADVGSSGTLSNSGIWSTPGANGSGSAITGNASSYRVRTTSALAFGGAAAITIAFRFKAASYSNSALRVLELCDSGGTISNSNGIAIYDVTGGLGWNFSSSGGAATAGRGGSITGPSTGAWHSMMFCIDRASPQNQYVFVDGVLQTINSPYSYGTQTTTWADKPMFFLADGNNAAWSAFSVDDVRVWTGLKYDYAYEYHLDTNG